MPTSLTYKNVNLGLSTSGRVGSALSAVMHARGDNAEEARMYEQRVGRIPTYRGVPIASTSGVVPAPAAYAPALPAPVGLSTYPTHMRTSSGSFHAAASASGSGNKNSNNANASAYSNNASASADAAYNPVNSGYSAYDPPTPSGNYSSHSSYNNHHAPATSAAVGAFGAGAGASAKAGLGKTVTWSADTPPDSLSPDQSSVVSGFLYKGGGGDGGGGGDESKSRFSHSQSQLSALPPPSMSNYHPLRRRGTAVGDIGYGVTDPAFALGPRLDYVPNHQHHRTPTFHAAPAAFGHAAAPEPARAAAADAAAPPAAAAAAAVLGTAGIEPRGQAGWARRDQAPQFLALPGMPVRYEAGAAAGSARTVGSSHVEGSAVTSCGRVNPNVVRNRNALVQTGLNRFLPVRTTRVGAESGGGAAQSQQQQQQQGQRQMHQQQQTARGGQMQVRRSNKY